MAERLRMTVAEVERMPAAEYQEWQAYWDLHPPFDPWEAFGTLCVLVNNLHVASRKDLRRPTDFMPAAYQPRKRQPQARIRAALGAVLAAVSPPSPCPNP